MFLVLSLAERSNFYRMFKYQLVQKTGELLYSRTLQAFPREWKATKVHHQCALINR